ncbi:bifunctional ornithine acetyltransferase/N-acetylglutamate synthase, partial [Rhizobium ruizarguesonis]
QVITTVSSKRVQFCARRSSISTGTATVWTCDLTKEYVAINGDYRS